MNEGPTWRFEYDLRLPAAILFLLFIMQVLSFMTSAESPRKIGVRMCSKLRRTAGVCRARPRLSKTTTLTAIGPGRPDSILLLAERHNNTELWLALWVGTGRAAALTRRTLEFYMGALLSALSRNQRSLPHA
jgi:hypothetical protein